MLRRRTRLQLLTRKSPRHSPQGRQYPSCRPLTIQRLRSVTSTVAVSQISKSTYRNKLHPSLVARVALLSNTMAQHCQHRPQGPHPNKPGILPPPRFSRSPTKTPPLVPWLSTAQLGPQTRVSLRTNGVYQPPCRRNFDQRFARSWLTTHLRGHPEDILCAIWSNSLRMWFISSLVHLSIGFVQFVRKADAERAIVAVRSA